MLYEFSSMHTHKIHAAEMLSDGWKKKESKLGSHVFTFHLAPQSCFTITPPTLGWIPKGRVSTGFVPSPLGHRDHHWEKFCLTCDENKADSDDAIVGKRN